MWKTIATSVLSGVVLATIIGAVTINSSVSALKESHDALRRDVDRIERSLGTLPQNISQLETARQALQRQIDRHEELLDRQDAQIRALGTLTPDVAQVREALSQLREELRAGLAQLQMRIEGLRASAPAKPAQ